jgi:hypothetical protein
MKSYVYFHHSPIEVKYRILNDEGEKLATSVYFDETSELFSFLEDLYEVSFNRYYDARKSIRKLESSDELDKYIDEAERLREQFDRNNLIPIKCPFTGALVFDRNGSHEPYVRTLIMLDDNTEADIYHEFNILWEIWDVFQEKIYPDYLNNKDISKQEYASIIGLLSAQYPWVDWGIVTEGPFNPCAFLGKHPLVKLVVDPNEYFGWREDVYYHYYFARTKHHSAIFDDLVKLCKDFKDFNSIY